MNPLIDNLLRCGELAAFVMIGWKVIRAINRFESVMRDFPPHAHVNGKIMFPRDFEPGRIESLKVNSVSAGQ